MVAVALFLAASDFVRVEEMMEKERVPDIAAALLERSKG